MPRLSRRLFLSGVISFLGPTLLSWGQAQALDDPFAELSELPPVPELYSAIADEPSMNQEFAQALSPLGTNPPSSEELALAGEIQKMLASKMPLLPVDIAGLLLDVARGGIYPEKWRSFARAWPRDANANPLILDFFKATATNPEGDTTAWCAAFLNWCILTAHGSIYPKGLTKPTRSASSGSFRRWGESVAVYDPAARRLFVTGELRVGDIAVFQRILSNGEGHPSQGHAAFLIDVDATRVRTLGGNQFEGKPVVHAINAKWIPMDSTSLRLISIRTADTLHVT